MALPGALPPSSPYKGPVAGKNPFAKGPAAQSPQSPETYQDSCSISPDYFTVDNSSGQSNYVDSEGRSALEQLQKQKPNKSNIVRTFNRLADIYRGALQSLDKKLALDCQLLALKYEIYIERESKSEKEKKSIRDKYRDPAKTLGINVPFVQSFKMMAAKFFTQVKTNTGRAVGKVVEEVLPEADHERMYTDPTMNVGGPVSMLPGGITSQKIFLMIDVSTDIGEVIHIPKEAPVSMHYTVGTTTQEQGTANIDYILFSSANYSIDKEQPATLSIVEGTPHNLFVNPNFHAVVAIENGRPQIINLSMKGEKGRTTLDEAATLALIEKTIASGGTLFQTNLIMYNGNNVVPSTGSSTEKDSRRVLVTFNDGGYGFVQINEFVDLYELGCLLSKIPGIRHAVNLDTGGSNIGGYKTTTGASHNLGVPDTPSATLVTIEMGPSAK